MGSRQIRTGRPRTWNISSEESFPSTRPKLDGWLGAPSHLSCWAMKKSSITTAARASFNDAYLSPKDKSCCKKYTRGLAATMQRLEPLWGMPSDKVSTGQPRWPTPLGLCAPAGGVNSTKADASARSGLADDTHHLAICCVGSGPRQSLAEGTQGLHAPAGRYRQILQVDRGSTPKQHQVRAGGDVLHQHYSSVRGPKLNHHRNGTQFTGKKFLDFCDDHHIRVDWDAVAHPMTNGQVERANGMILQGLKPRIYNDLNKFGKRWMKELPSVVWSLRTTPSHATGFTLFFLVYGAEAVLPTDLEYGSPRTKAYDDRSNQTSREDSLDQLEEARDVALLHSARYQQSLRRYHARSVRSRGFQVGDLVLHLR
jgi:transposase InsO family protein